jgi:protein-disulfide isomerase
MSELEEALKPQLANIERQRRKILEDGIDDVVNDRLLETEAAARGVEVPAMLQTEVESKLKPVEDAEAQAFYEANKARIRGPIEQMMPRIKEMLLGQQRNALQGALLDTLRTKYNPRVLLEPTRVDVKIAGEPAKGGKDAPVTIVEFSDFQCPYCSRVVPTIEQAVKTYGDQIQVVFKQFPLNSIHPMAQKAAEAALCAHEQGSFWKLHDAMFADQKSLLPDQLKSKAVELGLNAEQFNSCLDSAKYAPKVASSITEGSQAGVSGTPAMFVNGRFLSGAVPFETLSSMIDDELRRKGVTPKKAS